MTPQRNAGHAGRPIPDNHEFLAGIVPVPPTSSEQRLAAMYRRIPHTFERRAAGDRNSATAVGGAFQPPAAIPPPGRYPFASGFEFVV